YVTAAVRIDAVGVPVSDGEAADVDVVAAQQADVVVRRVVEGQIPDRDLTTLLERDQLGTAARAPVAVDPARPGEADVLQAASLQQGEVEVGGLAVRERLVGEPLVPREIGVGGGPPPVGARRP